MDVRGPEDEKDYWRIVRAKSFPLFQFRDLMDSVVKPVRRLFESTNLAPSGDLLQPPDLVS